MHFDAPLMGGRLLRRYKRFLADVELDNGLQVTAHTPNTGSMAGCCTPGARVWLRNSGNPGRKYPLSWELVETGPGVLVGINTGLPPALVREGISSGTIAELQGYESMRAEVKYGRENSRIDLLLQHPELPSCYVEVKNVTLADSGCAYFPDAVSSRGSRHLRELRTMADNGYRAVIFFCVQRGDVAEVRPADGIDPEYGRTLRDAIADGVEALAYRATVNTGGVHLDLALPVVCP